MMGLKPGPGHLILMFRLFSLMQGRASNEIKKSEHSPEIIRIFLGCLVWIEKSVPRVTVQHHKTCRGTDFSIHTKKP